MWKMIRQDFKKSWSVMEVSIMVGVLQMLYAWTPIMWHMASIFEDHCTGKYAGPPRTMLPYLILTAVTFIIRVITHRIRFLKGIWVLLVIATFPPLLMISLGLIISALFPLDAYPFLAAEPSNYPSTDEARLGMMEFIIIWLTMTNMFIILSPWLDKGLKLMKNVILPGAIVWLMLLHLSISLNFLLFLTWTLTWLIFATIRKNHGPGLHMVAALVAAPYIFLLSQLLPREDALPMNLVEFLVYMMLLGWLILRYGTTQIKKGWLY